MERMPYIYFLQENVVMLLPAWKELLKMK